MTWQDIPGWFDFEDVYVDAVRAVPAGGEMVEIGCWYGRSTAFLAQEIQRSGKRIKLFAVDTWRCTPGDDPVAKEIYPKFSEECGGDMFPKFMRNMEELGLHRIVFPLMMPSVHAARLFPSNSLDFVFIDGAHDYENVRTDIAVWKRRIRQGGVIAGHDLDFPGVSRAVAEEFRHFEIVGRSWRAGL